MPLAELDRVVLTEDLAGQALSSGDVGVVVHVYDGGEAYEVEVFSLMGRTIAVATVPAHALRPISPADVVSARTIAAE